MSRWAWHPGAWRGAGGPRACQLTGAWRWFQGPQLLSEIWGLRGGKGLVRAYPDLPEAPPGAWVGPFGALAGGVGGGARAVGGQGGYRAGDRLGNRLSRKRQELVRASCRRAGGPGTCMS